jgi:hypothetical protein
MKNFTALFVVGVAGVALCLVMTIYTGVKDYQIKNTPVPLTIPTPAIGN